VVNAIRAELDEQLTREVTAGAISPKGRTLAIACFDSPERCDVVALRHDRDGG
jgi:hypothetical protein